MLRRGHHVRGGYYWDRQTWSIVEFSDQRDALPGDVANRYVRIPLLLVLVAAPMLGALYVIVLPFVGLAMMVALLARAGWQRAHS